MKKIISISQSLHWVLLATCLFQISGFMIAMEHEQTPDEKNEKLLLAVINNQLDQVKFLLENGVDPNAEDTNSDLIPLNMAAYMGFLTIVQHLIKEGAAPDSTDLFESTPLFEAASEGHTAIVQFLLSKGANPSRRSLFGTTPLDVAETKEMRDLIQGEINKRTSSSHAKPEN